MNDSETYEYEGRRYIQPTLSSGEQEAFIDNLRDVQKQNNAQIAQQTQNLGTNVPSNLGGLGGGEAYFTSRYQTPQVNEMTNNLKAAAQAQALNDVMTNYQNQLQNRYKQAYRRAQRRAAARARSGGSSLADFLKNLLNPNGDPAGKGSVTEEDISGTAGKLGEGKGIAASPSDVPAGETYSYFYQGAVDKNGNPIGNTKGNTVAQNKNGKRVWSDAPSWSPSVPVSPITTITGITNLIR